jgi:hypothetical protein
VLNRSGKKFKPGILLHVYSVSVNRLLKNAHLSRYSGIALIDRYCGLRKIRLIPYNCLQAGVRDSARLASARF